MKGQWSMFFILVGLVFSILLMLASCGLAVADGFQNRAKRVLPSGVSIMCRDTEMSGGSLLSPLRTKYFAIDNDGQRYYITQECFDELRDIPYCR